MVVQHGCFNWKTCAAFTSCVIETVVDGVIMLLSIQNCRSILML